ncbi:MAG: RNA-directed DNA polymerase [Calditrichaeota bacterium]|nr:RNA-directed DNA polymerase [Calditrichota bacterium]
MANTRASKSLLKMSATEARSFFLKSENYFNNDLPEYFNFTSLLQVVSKYIESHSDGWNGKPNSYEKVNYKILSNKDGKYAWRPLQLIHPALYLKLVNAITVSENWKLLLATLSSSRDDRIQCLSIPVESLGRRNRKAEQILKWWDGIEQASLKHALEWEHIFHADIANCYSEIYTHSISWAIHGKPFMKKPENRDDKSLIGNIIDSCLRDMHNGQTNGIPQGSALMNFIAEIVLRACDKELERRLSKDNVVDYKVLRYVDDYRILTFSEDVGEEVLKALSETLQEYGLRLSVSKTRGSSNVISESVKADKIALFKRGGLDNNPQKKLLFIHSHSLEFPNSGSVTTLLTEFYRKEFQKDGKLLDVNALRKKGTIKDPEILISITVDIALRNPRTYPICSAIISALLKLLGSDLRLKILSSLRDRFERHPNTGFMQIWLQRISITSGQKFGLGMPLCDVVDQSSPDNSSLWNSDWMNHATLRKVINRTSIIDHVVKSSMKDVIEPREVDLFRNRNDS